MKTIKIAAGILMIAALAVSCIPKQESMGSAGQTLVKLSPDGFNMLAVDAKTTAQTGILFEVRRDVPSQTALNGTTTVVLKQDTSVIGAYNRANKVAFIELPANLATVTGVTAGSLTVTLGPGEFAKSVIVNIPSSASFDFSKSYALGFRLMSVSGEGAISLNVGTTIFAQVLAKNRFDGKYEATGTFVDYITTVWTGFYPKAVNLETSGALTVKKYDTDYGVYGYIFDVDGTGTSVSQFGAWTPAFVFDANNNVIDVVNTTNDPLPRQRTAVLYTGAGSINKYNPVTKTLDITYQLKSANTTPLIRNLITEHYVYKGPR